MRCSPHAKYDRFQDVFGGGVEDLLRRIQAESIEVKLFNPIGRVG